MSTLKVTAIRHASASSDGVTLNSDGTAVMQVNGGMNFRNRIINGDMRIDQRNAGASVTLSSSTLFAVDRFGGIEDTDGAMTAQQDSSAPAGFVNSLKFTTTTADATLAATQFARCQQRIEGYNIADLNWGSANAKTVTLSFWVRSSLTGTFGGALTNNGFDRSYPFTYTISVADTWEYKTVTIAGDTSGTWLTTSGLGIQVLWGLGVGSTYSGTAGAWAGAGYLSATGAVSVVGTNGATFYITGVQLEVGSVATPFERRDYGTELSRCQRYYYKTTGLIYGTPGSAGYALWYLKTSMRATPTVTGIPAGRTSDYTTTEYASVYTSSGYPYFDNPTASAEI